jgi:HAD superfamily hydrolase (TIGR01509 family)
MRINTVIFDMDGVLIDARDWHYEALNEALDIFGAKIPYSEHLGRFDGLPTKTKLSTLAEEGRVPKNLMHTIEAVKQERTLRAAAKLCFPRIEHILMLAELRRRGLGLAVATNSIRSTTQTMLAYAGVLEFMDYVVTNEDVKSPKPSPDVYLMACSKLGVMPESVLVVEDNVNGVRAAKSAGCKVLEVSDPSDLDLNLIDKRLEELGSVRDE